MYVAGGGGGGLGKTLGGLFWSSGWRATAFRAHLELVLRKGYSCDPEFLCNMKAYPCISLQGLLCFWSSCLWRCKFLENAGHPEALALQHRAEKVPALSPS